MAITTRSSKDNVILEAFRDALSSGEYETVPLAVTWVGCIMVFGRINEAECVDASIVQVLDALEVLTRLAHLGGDE